MTTIPGASQYIGAAILANTQGLAAQSTTLLGSAGSATSLLDAGRSIYGNNGIGLSARSRQLTNELLASTAAEANSLFSFTVGETSTVEAAQIQIKALRAKTPTDQLARSLVRVVDDGGVAEGEIGQTVDASV
ncbi:MAG: hypothetical protein H6861_05110 [Rhodospirillales bacterium]|nr:hypothetical protein [Rhodospirillales bacterium]